MLYRHWFANTLYVLLYNTSDSPCLMDFRLRFIFLFRQPCLFISAGTQDIMDITKLSQTGVSQNTGYPCKGNVVHLDICLSLTAIHNLTQPEKFQIKHYTRQILNDFSKNILFWWLFCCSKVLDNIWYIDVFWKFNLMNINMLYETIFFWAIW